MYITSRRELLTSAYLVLVSCLFCLSHASAQEEAAAEKKEKENVHTVEASPLRVEVELDGTAVAEETTEVAVDPESWAEWTVTDAVGHGVHVRKGDVLVRFDTKKIDEAIADLELELELLDLTMEQAERALPLAERTLAMDTEDAQRSHRQTMEDTEYYMNVEKPLDRKSTEMSLKSSQQRYENTLEELIQLEKMYESDDLIEETEEIILKRQRFAVEAAKLSLERAEAAHDRAMDVGLPRQEQSAERKLARSELSTTKATQNVELALRQKKLEHEKQKITQRRQHEKLEKLQQDREAMVLHAPAAGTVYYGQSDEGKWSKIGAMRAKLRPHGKVSAHEVVMTIVGDGPIQVAAKVPEAKLSELKPGMSASVTFPALGEASIDGRVESLTSALVADGQFAATVTLDPEGRRAAKGLTPGMNAKIKLVAYANRNAVLIPKAAVQSDEWDNTGDSVVVVDELGNETKRAVKTGRKQGDRIEIVSGLSVGDRVLLKPKSKGE